MKPQRKVVAGGIAGAVSSIVVWLLSLSGIDVPAEQAVAITTVITFVVQYLVPSQESTPNA